MARKEDPPWGWIAAAIGAAGGTAFLLWWLKFRKQAAAAAGAPGAATPGYTPTQFADEYGTKISVTPSGARVVTSGGQIYNIPPSTTAPEPQLKEPEPLPQPPPPERKEPPPPEEPGGGGGGGGGDAGGALVSSMLQEPIRFFAGLETSMRDIRYIDRFFSGAQLLRGPLVSARGLRPEPAVFGGRRTWKPQILAASSGEDAVMYRGEWFLRPRDGGWRKLPHAIPILGPKGGREVSDEDLLVLSELVEER